MVNMEEYNFQRRFGWEQIKREKYINELIDNTEDKFQIIYRNVLEKLPVIKVPIELPMYRLENGRTISLQDEYIVEHEGIGADFFTRDKNSIEAQEVQHSLLQKLIKTTALDKYFKDKSNKQTEPIICTKQGFVVNGNRRLCCWRDLYYSDPAAYSHFKYIDIALLPIDDEEAIEQLESDLQIAPDIKDDYIWHAEAMMMKYQRDTKHKDMETIRKFFRKGSTKDVDELIEMFDYADEYLTKRGLSKHWSQVDDKKFAFREMVIQRKRMTSAIDKEIFKGLSFAIIDNAGEDRAYNRIKEAKKYFEKIATEIKREVSPPPGEHKSESQVSFEILLGGSPESDDVLSASELAEVVNDINNSETISAIIADVVEGEKLLDKEAKSASYVADLVCKANALLQSAIAADFSNQVIKTDGIKEQLASIEDCVYRLKEWVKNEVKN